MEPEIIHYTDWQTGEKQEYSLGNHGWSVENISKRKCPFDYTPLIFAYDDRSERLFCPNCGEDYSKNSTQKEIDEQARNHLLDHKKDLEELEETRADLEARIKHAEEVGLLPKDS